MAFDKQTISHILQLSVLSAVTFLVAKNFLDLQDLKCEIEYLKHTIASCNKQRGEPSIQEALEEPSIQEEEGIIDMSDELDCMFNRYSFTLGLNDEKLSTIEELPEVEEQQLPQPEEETMDTLITHKVLEEDTEEQKKKPVVRKRKTKKAPE